MIIKAPTVEVRDEGVVQGRARAVDFVGTGVAAAVSGGVATITINLAPVPTGTGFRHITAGVEDAAAKLVDTADVNNNQITYTKMQDVSATQRVIGRNTAGAGDPEEVTLSQLLDWIGSAAQGDILYRGAAGWERLAAGTATFRLQTGGASANPSWVRAINIIELSADVGSSASTAFQDITGLSFAVTSGVNYRWRATLLYTTSAATIGIRVSMTGPAFTHNAYITQVGLAVNGSASNIWGNTASAADTGTASTASMNTTGGNIVIASGIIRPSANGTVQLRFAPETATLNGVVIEAGSTLEWW